MQTRNLLAPEAVIPRLDVTSKKQALQELSAYAAGVTNLSERQIFDALLERERLGTTGIGRGVAIPHSNFEGLEKIIGVFARLPEPIDFDAPDNEPVDLIFLLLVPREADADHLHALARVSRLFRHEEARAELRACTDGKALYGCLTRDGADRA
ncbi:MAG: PTS sugar transporter subunit IIA [Sphingomonadales bacterium]